MCVCVFECYCCLDVHVGVGVCGGRMCVNTYSKYTQRMYNISTDVHHNAKRIYYLYHEYIYKDWLTNNLRIGNRKGEKRPDMDKSPGRSLLIQ